MASDMAEVMIMSLGMVASDAPCGTELTIDTADPAVGSIAADSAITKVIIMRKIRIAVLSTCPDIVCTGQPVKFRWQQPATLLRQIARSFIRSGANAMAAFAPRPSHFPREA
jgi:hypothetical protein